MIQGLVVDCVYRRLFTSAADYEESLSDNITFPSNAIRMLNIMENDIFPSIFMILLFSVSPQVLQFFLYYIRENRRKKE